MASTWSDEQVSELLDGLRSGPPDIRKASACVLAAVGTSHDAVVPALTEALLDPDPAVRLAVGQALGTLGAQAVPLLIDKLLATPPGQREAILGTLALMGRDARTALPLLDELHHHPELGEAAARAGTAIRERPPVDWGRLLKGLTVWLLIIGVLLELASEALSWAGVFNRAQGVALQIAIGWAIIGAYFGTVVGLRFGGGKAALIGVKVLALAGASVGLVIGKLVAIALGPLGRVLVP